MQRECSYCGVHFSELHISEVACETKRGRRVNIVVNDAFHRPWQVLPSGPFLTASNPTELLLNISSWKPSWRASRRSPDRPRRGSVDGKRSSRSTVSVSNGTEAPKHETLFLLLISCDAALEVTRREGGGRGGRIALRVLLVTAHLLQRGKQIQKTYECNCIWKNRFHSTALPTSQTISGRKKVFGCFPDERKTPLCHLFYIWLKEDALAWNVWPSTQCHRTRNRADCTIKSALSLVSTCCHLLVSLTVTSPSACCSMMAGRWQWPLESPAYRDGTATLMLWCARVE